MKNKKLTFSKILFFIVFFTFFQNNSISQTDVYHPFPTEFASWTYRHYVFSGEFNETYGNIIWYGDTIINDVTYIKKSGNYEGVFRQDIPNEKIFFLDSQDIEHDVSISSHLSLGDTVVVDTIIYNVFTGSIYQTNNGPDSIKVEQIDSTLIGDSYRQRIIFTPINIFSEWSGGIEYIQGIGFESLNGFEHGRNLTCFHVNNEQIWGGNHPQCTNSTEEQEILSFNIYPNPATEKLTIECDEEGYDIKLYDLYGKIVYSKLNNLNSTSIDVSELPTGFTLPKLH